MTDLTSRLYNPTPESCCDACVFGRGEHATWCERRPAEPSDQIEDFIDTVIAEAEASR